MIGNLKDQLFPMMEEAAKAHRLASAAAIEARHATVHALTRSFITAGAPDLQAAARIAVDLQAAAADAYRKVAEIHERTAEFIRLNAEEGSVTE